MSIKLHGKRGTGLRRWEIALMLGFVAALVSGLWLTGEQAAFSEKVIRLHVIANSDSEGDQALKLRVRDRILEESRAWMTAGAGLEETRGLLEAHLEELTAAAGQEVAAAGYEYRVTAGLEDRVWFPTREYQDFALPAGRYTALRVVLGEGAGQNWWCVVFPPLCLGAVTEPVEETAAAAGLSPSEVSLITGATDGYVVKFKTIELWNKLTDGPDSGR
ncbi:MAG: stage II sporulation protein R [Clostridiales bacterium]|nr:stage II sporulation protein R [Clostridiales bacterium]